MDYIAHVKRLENGEWAKPQPLTEHLIKVAELAAGFAANFNSSEWAYALGMCHDVGKGTPEWQNYIRSKSSYDEEASSETIKGRLDHSTPAAKLTEEILGKAYGRILSYCVAGHHSGLPDLVGGTHPQSALAFRLQNASADEIDDCFKVALKELRLSALPWKFGGGLDLSLWIRMLFSCLIDADRLDTERYMSPKTSEERNGYASIGVLLDRFNGYTHEKTKPPIGDANMNVYNSRQSILRECIDAARQSGGFFSLSAPTGGGKTLASMAFALNRAQHFCKKRIIYVIPYTSIIEQNAGVFREIFGDDEALEHHSALDENEQSIRSRLAAENWDAPIIVTTTVQFYESLFSSKASRCRKLHSIVDSVVILDEAQLIPTDFLAPILEALKLLTERYKTTIVACTATQPSLENQDDFPMFKGLPKGSVKEIVRDVPKLFGDLKRTEIEMPKDETPIEWTDLARELSEYDQVLCVVSDRKSCRELHALMPANTYHLSALMCAEHRSTVIKEIKDKLERSEPIRVISTQLVEAGVDIDFPVVYRAMAGLDSIAQAAGRCNREGKLNIKGKLGRVVAFNAPKKAPTGMLRKAADTTLELNRNGLINFADHKSFAEYFKRLYEKANSLDKESVIKLLTPDRSECGIQFREASDKFNIIDDRARQSILVPYREGAKLIETLKAAKIAERKLLRKLQRYTVSIQKDQFSAMKSRGSLEEVFPGIYVLNNDLEYSDKIGLAIDEALDSGCILYFGDKNE
ncbi:MAG: CRISPR-associated helicase Cas3' [Helicobacteraceae bacterium]|nr:CRISPR-associated helicase Cas3' [Helicobacteraceae bacterium]